MKFIEYIEEVFNSSYDYKKEWAKKGCPFHKYNFSADGDNMSVSIHHDPAVAGLAHVDFTSNNGDKGTVHVTGKHPKTAARVFSTVGNIMRSHAAEHGIDTYSMLANDKEPSRVKLYHNIIKKHGGEYWGKERGFHTFSLPVK